MTAEDRFIDIGASDAEELGLGVRVISPRNDPGYRRHRHIFGRSPDRAPWGNPRPAARNRLFVRGGRSSELLRARACR